MQTIRSIVNNAASFAMKGKDNMQSGATDRSRTVVWFFFVACGFSITFRTLDSCFFSEEDLNSVELFAVLAFAIGVFASRVAARRHHPAVAAKRSPSLCSLTSALPQKKPVSPPTPRVFPRGRRAKLEAEGSLELTSSLRLSSTSSQASMSARSCYSDASTAASLSSPTLRSRGICARGGGAGTLASFEEQIQGSPFESVQQVLDSGAEAEPSELLQGIISSCHCRDLITAEKLLGHLSRARPSAASPSASSGKLASGAYVNAAIEACIASAGARRASAWLGQFHAAGYQPAAKTLLLVLEALIEAFEPAQAEQLLSRMEVADAPLDASCYQVLFQHCIPTDDIARTEAWLQRIGKRGNEDLSQAYVALIRARSLSGLETGREGASLQSNAGASEVPQAALRRAVEQIDFWMAHAGKTGVAKNTKMANAAIQAYTRAGETGKAELCLADMEQEAKRRSATPASSSNTSPRTDEQHYAPDVFSYSAIMDAYAQQGATAKAEEWFARMIGVGIRPDAVSFNTVIKAHARNGDVVGAEQWLERARKHKVQLDSFGYNAVIAAAARAGDSATAEQWLRQMHKDGANPDVVSFNSVINARAKLGDATRAVKLIDMMCESGVEPDVVTLGVVVHACAKAGDAHLAEAVFHRIVARGQVKPDAISYNALIDAFVKAGETQRAERYLAVMLDEGVPPSVVSYTTVLHAHARAGDVEAAERGIERMLEDGIEANVVSYSALIHACVKAGDIDRAEAWFEKMKSAGVQANVVSYSVILNVCAKAGDVNRAERWLQTMCAEGVEPNVVCYNSVIDACAKAGRGDRAEFWLKRLCEASKSQPKSTCQPHAALHSRSPASRNANAVRLAPTRQSYTTAAQAYATHGAWADVERIFNEMQAGGLSMDEFSLTVLLSAYSRARPRQRERAEAAFLRHAAANLPVTRPPLRVLRTVVGVQRFGQLLQALPPEVRSLKL